MAWHRATTIMLIMIAIMITAMVKTNLTCMDGLIQIGKRYIFLSMSEKLKLGITPAIQNKSNKS